MKLLKTFDSRVVSSSATFIAPLVMYLRRQLYTHFMTPLDYCCSFTSSLKLFGSLALVFSFTDFCAVLGARSVILKLKKLGQVLLRGVINTLLIFLMMYKNILTQALNCYGIFMTRLINQRGFLFD